MSRKHNTRHNRGRSNYPRRLRARGLTRAPRMTSYDVDRLMALARKEGRAAELQEAS